MKIKAKTTYSVGMNDKEARALIAFLDRALSHYATRSGAYDGDASDFSIAYEFRNRLREADPSNPPF